MVEVVSRAYMQAMTIFVSPIITHCYLMQTQEEAVG